MSLPIAAFTLMTLIHGWGLSGGQATNAVAAGRFIVEPPTLICLGFEWEIAGDENRNASVAVEYRRPGDGAWKHAMPLLRMGGEKPGQLFDVDRFGEVMIEARFLSFAAIALLAPAGLRDEDGLGKMRVFS